MTIEGFRLNPLPDCIIHVLLSATQAYAESYTLVNVYPEYRPLLCSMTLALDVYYQNYNKAPNKVDICHALFISDKMSIVGSDIEIFKSCAAYAKNKAAETEVLTAGDVLKIDESVGTVCEEPLTLDKVSAYCEHLIEPIWSILHDLYAPERHYPLLLEAAIACYRLLTVLKEDIPALKTLMILLSTVYRNEFAFCGLIRQWSLFTNPRANVSSMNIVRAIAHVLEVFQGMWTFTATLVRDINRKKVEISNYISGDFPPPVSTSIRSRSGRGAHLWILFSKPVDAATARNFGFLLLDKGASSVNLKSFKYYDRMYPSQDTLNSIGNLIALPLQGQAVRNGNSVFVDENWNAYPNQLGHLFAVKKLSHEEIRTKINQWQLDLITSGMSTDYSKQKYRPKPWNREQKLNSSDVVGSLSIILADGIYVDMLNTNPRLQNQIRCMATIDNPVFHKNKRLGYSNYYNFSSIYLGMDVDGYIKIPRGLLEKLTEACDSVGIKYTIDDQRERGVPIKCSFMGSLKDKQDIAAGIMLTTYANVLTRKGRLYC